jgi:hypothetical protein
VIMSLWGTLRQRTQVSCSNIPDPQQLWDNNYSFKWLHWGTLLYRNRPYSMRLA